MFSVLYMETKLKTKKTNKRKREKTMKKKIVLIIAALVVVALVIVALVTGNQSETPADTTTTTTTTTPAGPTDAELAANASIEEIANNLINKYAEFADVETEFNNMMAEMDEADRISFEEYLTYCLSVTSVEANSEWLMGLMEAPTGYSEAYVYQPSTMGAPFIGYVFRLEEGTNVESFKQALKDNADLRWNICTSANTIICENFENIVLFSMLVVADEEHPDGFTAEQKDAFYATFLETIKK